MSLPRSLEEWRGEEAAEKGDFQEAPANSAGRGNPCKGAAGSSEGGRVADARGHREGGQTQKQSHRDQLGRKGHHCCSSLLNTKCKGGLKKRKTREGKPPGKAGPAACPSVTRGGMPFTQASSAHLTVSQPASPRVCLCPQLCWDAGVLPYCRAGLSRGSFHTSAQPLSAPQRAFWDVW